MRNVQVTIRSLYMFLGLEFIPAFIKICFQIAFAIVSAIPFHYAWNWVIPIYFGVYVPAQFWHIPYWHFVGLLLVVSCVGEQIQKLTPKIISIQNSSKSE